MAATFRVGIGYDVHRLTAGRALVLGGVRIPFEQGLKGHSDADCLTHAIADAILGAAGLPDIGHYFPDTDLKYKDLDSQEILKRACREAARLGFALSNVDSVIIAEAPKMGPYLAAMKEKLAAAMKVPPSSIGIKATTHEKLGDLGKGLGIAAQAVCLLVQIGQSEEAIS